MRSAASRLVFSLALLTCGAEENATKSSEVTLNVGGKNLSLVMQPLQAKRTAIALNSSGGDQEAGRSFKKDNGFRPSPQLETYLEFNRIPVQPVVGEAKNFYQQQQHGDGAHKPGNFAWPGRNPGANEDAWTARVKFPSGASNEHPYPFVTDEKSHSVVGNRVFPPPLSPKPPKNEAVDGRGHHSVDKFEYGKGQRHYGIDKFEYEPPAKAQTQLALEKPPGDGHNVKASPWKSVVKLLATFIPIGLLISALTPSVITIMPMSNMTKNRGRAQDEDEAATSSRRRVLSSLSYLHRLDQGGCEEKILCEMLSASDGGELQIRRLSKLFEEEEENEGFPGNADGLKAIFEAVQAKNCDLLSCEAQENPGSSEERN